MFGDFYDSQKNTLDPFKNEMTGFQLLVYELTLDSLSKRSLVWKDFESNNISLSVARNKSDLIQKNMDIEIEKKYGRNNNE